ncbi:hypothetical protein PDIG_67020 [Penicillium digitatum PHI26]|uniref:Uncharacterized protein n=2 Tax=Penicillium digitatum TaxID=36651 RepID=K9G1V2_PEND2|nr:hypothetical protein PDIP_76320 [Penicillium digitatum Pd1]EKV06811.1 hypothetical protein PDIP_76320 [Penicillium digitatum Pd1]EKV08838.1 hypothetical protein PDIG_67020 [Penicillium digitatum PHI26]
MGNRPLEETSQHLDTQVPGTDNQPRPNLRCETLVYLTKNKEIRMYPRDVYLNTGLNPFARTESKAKIPEYRKIIPMHA